MAGDYSVPAGAGQDARGPEKDESPAARLLEALSVVSGPRRSAAVPWTAKAFPRFGSAEPGGGR